MSQPTTTAVIFDCDGTLVDVASVRHHVEGPGRKDFNAFHYGSSFCPPISWVLDAVGEHIAADNAIIVVTAREEKWRELTTNWLLEHGVLFDELHMRPTGDFRKDVLIKGEILDELETRYQIRHAYDDNPAIIALWKERGVPHTVVPGWPAATAEAHYYATSHNWDGPNRLCGECNLTYDAGNHTEITTLKPFTSYVCSTGGASGHSSKWTGINNPIFLTPTSHLCVCGAEYVEEDAEKWLLTWEMQTPYSEEWKTVTKTQSRHAAYSQRDGLMELIGRGEAIRNVQLRSD